MTGSLSKRLRRHNPNKRNINPQNTDHPRDSSAMPESATRIVSSQELRSLNNDERTAARITLPLTQQLQELARLRVQTSEYTYPVLLEELGYFGVLDTAHHECLKARQEHPFAKDLELAQLPVWKHIGVQILADVPLTLLQSLLDGSLARKVCHPSPEDTKVHNFFDQTEVDAFLQEVPNQVSHWVARLHTAEEHVPVIYARIFHDDNGDSPSLHQLQQIVNCLRKYLTGDQQDDELCASIDNQSRPNTSTTADIRAGRHFFLQGKTDRAQTVLTFTAALSEAMVGYETLDNQARHHPWTRSLKYIGYSNNFTRRTQQHDTKSSSWLMELFDHVCRHLFRNEAGIPVFNFNSYVVAYPITYKERQLAEELFCRISTSYYYTGLGFNTQNAGVSVVSSRPGEASANEAEQVMKRLAQARYEVSTWELQLFNDFNTFNQTYTERCEQDRSPSALQALEREGVELQKQVDEHEQSLPPITDLQEAVRSDMAASDELERRAAFQDDESKSCLQSLRHTSLQKQRQNSREHWGEGLGM